MLVERIRRESGYSLVEVMASIVILALAILPMVGMFDTGLKSATAGSNYDKARALANLKLEEAKSLPFANVRDNFPETAPTTTTYNGSGKYVSAWKTEPGAVFTNFQYRITKQYMAQPPTDSDLDPADPSEDFAASPPTTSLIRVSVIVGWGEYESVTDSYSNEYTMFGLVAE